MTSRLLPTAVLVALLVASRAASADVPGPKPHCDAEGHGCAECWRPYAAHPDSQKAFDACQDAAKAKGLVEACGHRQGAGDAVFFCPQGVAVKTKIVGGCAGCALDASAAPDGLGAMAVGLGVLALRRRRLVRRERPM